MGLGSLAYLLLGISGFWLYRRRSQGKPRPGWLRPFHYLTGITMVILVLGLLTSNRKISPSAIAPCWDKPYSPIRIYFSFPDRLECGAEIFTLTPDTKVLVFTISIMGFYVLS